MKDKQIKKLIALLPEEYLDEALHYQMMHMQQQSAAKSAGKRNRNAAEDIIRQDRKIQKKLQKQKKKQEKYTSEVYIMKKEARKGRMLALILAAAVLALGGTAAAVAYGVHRRVQQHDLESTLTEEQTPPDLENALIHPQLTDQQDEPECHGFAKTETGFFYHAGVEDYPLDKNNRAASRALWYYDEEEKQSVVVCAKPNCLHDGNEYCTATTQNYSICSEPVYLDGYVYAAAQDRREVIQNPENCTDFPTVLLRYAPDGTEVTEIAELMHSEYECSVNAEIIAHRGQLWIMTAYTQYIYSNDDNFEMVTSEQRGAFSMFCYEPVPQKLTQLCTSGEPIKDYHQFTWQSGCSFKGYGDYVYFLKSDSDWRDPIKGAGVFCIDCRTGIIVQAAEAKSGKCRSYTISGKHIYYLYVDSYYSETRDLICDYNMETGERREIAALEAIIQREVPDYTTEEAEKTGPFGGNIITVYTCGIYSDKEHIYVSWEIQDARGEEMREIGGFTELDFDGNILRFGSPKAMPYPEEFIRAWVQKNGYFIDTEEGYRKENHIPPEKLTEDDIEQAVKNWHKDEFLKDSVYQRFDGTYFWLAGAGYQYRISAADLFAGKAPERLYQR